MTKFEVSQNVKRECDSLKSRLIDHLRTLENEGLAKDARRLERIIGNLEAWQNS